MSTIFDDIATAVASITDWDDVAGGVACVTLCAASVSLFAAVFTGSM